jgi:hypothetical protein
MLAGMVKVDLVHRAMAAMTLESFAAQEAVEALFESAAPALAIASARRRCGAPAASAARASAVSLPDRIGRIQQHRQMEDSPRPRHSVEVEQRAPFAAGANTAFARDDAAPETLLDHRAHQPVGKRPGPHSP